MTQASRFFGAISLSFFLATATHAQLNWGADGAGGSGTWDETTANWYDGSANVAWTDGAAAVFGGTGGTVAVDGLVTASSLTFNTAGYTISGGFLNGTSTGLTVQTSNDAIITSAIFGNNSGNFVKSGSGDLTVSTMAFFQQVNVTQGCLILGSFGASDLTAVYNLSNTAGAALVLGAGPTTYFIGGLGGGGTTGGAVNVGTAPGTYTLYLAGGAAPSSYSGVLQDNGSAVLGLMVVGATQTLTAANTYSGTTYVGLGELTLSDNGSILNSAVSLSGGTLQIDNSGTNGTNRLSDTAAMTLGGGTFLYQGNSSAASTETAGQLQVNQGASTVTVNAGTGQTATMTFNGLSRVQGGGTVNFNGTGTTRLAGASNTNGILGGYATYGGTEWAAIDGNNNVVAFTGYVADLNAAAATDNVKVSGSGTTTLASSKKINSLNQQNSTGTVGTIDLGGHTLDVVSGGILAGGTTANVIQNGALTSSEGELIVTGISDQTITANIVDSSMAVSLTVSSAGTVRLGGNNTYTGATTINQGTLLVQSATALSAGALNLGNGASLNLNGFNATVAGLSGSGGIALGTARLTIAGAASTTFIGNISGTGGLTKSGSGTLILEGQNSYTGTTIINEGEVLLQEAELSSSSAWVLNGGTLGLGSVGGTPTLGTLTLQANSTIDLSQAAAWQFSFADSSAIAWSGTLTIEGYDRGIELQFGTSADGLTAAQLSEIVFGGSDDFAALDANGYLMEVAAPEPGSLVLLAGGLLAASLAWARLRARGAIRILCA